jgi:hypothetical protein
LEVKVASRYPPFFDIVIKRFLLDAKPPTYPGGLEGPTLDEVADVFLAAAEYPCCLLDREKGRGH